MMYLIVVIVAFLVIRGLVNCIKNKKIIPPTEDVKTFGCGMGDCGYLIPEFQKNAKGEFDAIPGLFYCKYCKKTIKRGSKCPFAEDHPELLRTSLFDVFDE